jgi:exonuclease VII small subunit
VSPLLEQHEALKATRGRGEGTPNYRATLVFLNRLEEELQRVQDELDAAWIHVNAERQYRKCARHLDHAQQRMHRMIKRLKRRADADR